MIALLASAPSWAGAEDIAVPVPLQASLLVKVAGYDRNMVSRAQEKVRVLIVTKSGHGDSGLVANQLQRALAEEKQIAGRPFDTEVMAYSSAADLVKACQEKRIAIVYITPGFKEQEIQIMGEQLGSLNILSMGALASYVTKGLVLGVDLISGKPKIVVNLPQARKQSVQFDANLLNLTKVIQ